jgi:DNA-binding Lrp family transcriptional regulator
MQKILQQLLFDGQGSSHDHGNKLEHRPALSREEMRRRVSRLRKMKVKRRKMALVKKRRETGHGSRASVASTSLSIISETDSELPLFDPVQVQRNLDNNAKMYFKMARQRRHAGESSHQVRLTHCVSSLANRRRTANSFATPTDTPSPCPQF